MSLALRLRLRFSRNAEDFRQLLQPALAVVVLSATPVKGAPSPRLTPCAESVPTRRPTVRQLVQRQLGVERRCDLRGPRRPWPQQATVRCPRTSITLPHTRSANQLSTHRVGYAIYDVPSALGKIDPLAEGTFSQIAGGRSTDQRPIASFQIALLRWLWRCGAVPTLNTNTSSGFSGRRPPSRHWSCSRRTRSSARCICLC
jgi:hypothetical protein